MYLMQAVIILRYRQVWRVNRRHGFLVAPDYPEQQRGVAWKQVELERIWSRTAFVWTDSGLEPGIKMFIVQVVGTQLRRAFFRSAHL